MSRDSKNVNVSKFFLDDCCNYQNLKKHVAAIHISNRLTITQRKASNVLLHHAYDNLLTARVHKIRVKDLAEAIGFNTHNMEPLKEALKTLARTILEWNILDESGSKEEWGTTTLLAQAVIRGGYCIYAYSPELCEKLYRPEIYALLNLSIQRKFSSGYALALYENCLRYRKIGTTGWISIYLLKRLLGICESSIYYNDFRKLNDKIIKPAVRQVNITSDLLLEVEYQREFRKISAIKFRVFDNPNINNINKEENYINENDLLNNNISLSNTEIAMNNINISKNIYKKIKNIGLNSEQIKLFISNFNSDYLREDFNLLSDSNIQEYLFSNFNLNVNNDSKIFDNLTNSELKILESNYISNLENNSNFEMQLLLNLYKKNGLNSKIVKNHFRNFVFNQIINKFVNK